MRRRSLPARLAALVLVVTAVVGSTAVGAQDPSPPRGKPTARFVLLFDRDTAASVQDDVAGNLGTVVERIDALDARVIEVPGPRARASWSRARLDDAVRRVELDAVRSADVVPNDLPGFPASPAQVDLPEAWEYTTGAASTVIAIIDTGVNGIAPDLSRSRFVAPINVITGTTNVGDTAEHGTRVASVAGMVGNNGRLAAGACWSCSIMPVKALSADGFGLASHVAEGIVWAVDHGADVINLSLSGSSSGIEKAAIDYAEQHNVVVVAAAGNEGSSTPRYPAAHPTVIGVAASGSTQDAREPYSNLGSWVDVAAPGSNASVSGHGLDVATVNGTSSASPLVAGIVGLMRSENAGLSAAQIRSALLSSAVDVPYVSGGRVDADAALVAIGGGLTAPPGAVTGAPAVLEDDPTDVVGAGLTTSGVVGRTVSARQGPFSFDVRCAWCGGMTLEVLDGNGTVVPGLTLSGGTRFALSGNLPGNGTFTFRLRAQRWGLVSYLLTYTQ